MQLQEVISMLRWINESDPRFPFNESTAEKWHYALRTVDAAVAKQAVLEHVKKHDTVPAPSQIATRARSIVSSREAGQNALDKTREIEAAPLRRPKTEADYRRKIRNTPKFRELFEQGRREGNAARAAATKAREGAQAQDEWAA